MNYPPPFQDLPTLSAHTTIGESTIMQMVKEGRFPQPCKVRLGKHIWRWSTVEKFLSADDNSNVTSIADATRRAVGE